MQTTMVKTNSLDLSFTQCWVTYAHHCDRYTVYITHKNGNWQYIHAELSKFILSYHNEVSQTKFNLKLARNSTILNESCKRLKWERQRKREGDGEREKKRTECNRKMWRNKWSGNKTTNAAPILVVPYSNYYIVANACQWQFTRCYLRLLVVTGHVWRIALMIYSFLFFLH